MSIYLHHLTGCAPAPLAHYLKALGILRLVAEHPDPAARLWWQDEHAILATKLDETEVVAFFTQEYQPSPIVAPWNAGSGFYTGNDAKDAAEVDGDEEEPGDGLPDAEVETDVFALLGVNTDKRLNGLRDAVRAAQQTECQRFTTILEEARSVKKALNKDKTNAVLKERSADADKKKKTLKDQIVQDCFKTWRGHQLDWLMAGAIPTGDQKHPVFYPQHLGGSGGANGKLDFSSNFAQSVVALFTPNNQTMTSVLLQASLKLQPVIQDRGLTKGRTTGQYLPSTIKAPNGTSGFFSERSSNPWDLVFAMEGALLLQCGVYKKLNDSIRNYAVAPFSVEPAASAFAGGATPSEKTSAEQWLPLWEKPATLAEVKNLFVEGRATIGRSQSSSPVDVARSLGRLGVQRGLTQLVRYGYPQRNGKGHLAVALGRWKVEPNPHRDLTDNIVHWIQMLISKSNGKNIPGTWQAAARRCEEALMAVCQYGRDTRRWEELLLALGAAENTLGRTPKKAHDAFLKPLRDLPGNWLQVLPNSMELRLAAALANQYGLSAGGASDWGEPIRIHSLPCDWDETFKRWNTGAFAERASVETVAVTGDFLRDATAILRRRMLAAGGGLFPLCAGHGHFAHPADVAAFLRGDVDEARLWALARPLMALNWREARPLHPERGTTSESPPPLYGLFRLAHLSEPLHLDGINFQINTDPAMLTSLLANNASRGMAIAIRRLTAVGLRPFLRTAVADATLARRLAASLLFPVSREYAERLALTLCKPTIHEPHALAGSPAMETTTEGVPAHDR